MTKWNIRDAWKWGLPEVAPASRVRTGNPETDVGDPEFLGPEFLSVGDCRRIETEGKLLWKRSIAEVHEELNRLAWRCAALAFVKGQQLEDWIELKSKADKLKAETKDLDYPLNELGGALSRRLEWVPKPVRGPKVDWRTRMLGNCLLQSFQKCTGRKPAAGVGPAYRFIEEFGKALTPALNFPVWGADEDVATVRQFWLTLEKFADGTSKPPLEKWVAEYPKVSPEF